MIPITDIQSVQSLLKQEFSLADDFVLRTMTKDTHAAKLFFVKSVCDAEFIQNYITRSFWQTGSANEYEYFLQSLPGGKVPQDFDELKTLIVQGFVCVVIGEWIYLVEARKPQESPVTDAQVEVIVQGPQDAFNSNIYTNLNLIRYRYKCSSLKVEFETIGSQSKTMIALVYDESLHSPQLLNRLKSQIESIQVDILPDAGQLVKMMSGQQIYLFPTILTTERPDRVVKAISEGKVCVLVDRTQFALVTPSQFSDFMSSMDDQVQTAIVGYFLKVLRYIGLFFSILLPGLYVAIVSYNPEFVRVQLALSIAASRTAVPYPSYLEVLFMMIMMELLTEASIRLPKSVGPTATTVGGLILGQSATEAGLVSTIMVIVVASVAISTFLVPINTMGFSIRVVKYPILFLTIFYGLVGWVIGTMALIFYLANLDSLGEPFLKLFRKGETG